jgi:hypothetical protein
VFSPLFGGQRSPADDLSKTLVFESESDRAQFLIFATAEKIKGCRDGRFRKTLPPTRTSFGGC